MKVLVAGIGNVFLGDDGFGVEVAHRLARRELPPGVEVRDFGIRGVHLAYQLLEAYDLVVLVDAMHRDRPPGSLYVLEPEPDPDRGMSMDAHDLDPEAVLALVPLLGGALGETVVVGCEPETVDARMGLSPVVAAAVEPAVDLVIRVVTEGVPARVPATERSS
jgi:hydrogenase maturation protease